MSLRPVFAASCIATFLVAAPAIAITPTTGPKDAGLVACVESPARVLAWVDGARTFLSRLGITAGVLDAASERSKAIVGQDLLDPAGWRAAGLDPEKPVCLHWPTGEGSGMALSFGVDSERRVRDAAGHAEAALATRDGGKAKAATVTSLKIGHVKAWLFEPGGSKAKRAKKGAPVEESGPHLVLAMDDDTGFIALDKADLQFLAGDLADYADRLGMPGSGIAVAVVADVAALGRRLKDDAVTKFAATWAARVRLVATLDKGTLTIKASAANMGLLAMAAEALAKATAAPDKRLAVADRVDDASAGFVQVNLPIAAIVAIAQAARGGGMVPAPGASPAPPVKIGTGAWGDLVRCLGGDVTLVEADGLAGLAAMASVTDAAACETALSGLAAQAQASGFALSDQAVDLAGAKGHLFRFGKPDAAFRFPVYAVVRDGTLVMALAADRAADLLSPPREKYLDHVDVPMVKDGLKHGAFLAAHGYGTDLLGNLTSWGPILRDALGPSVRKYLDYLDLPAVALDLLYDGAAVLDVGKAETTATVTARFLPADPMSAEPRERAYGMAMRARAAGRSTAWRAALLDMMKADPADRYGRKARRILLSPDPLSETAVAAGLVVAMYFTMQAPEPEEPQADETPCQKYLMAACVGDNPDSATCKDARHYFDKGDGVPTPKDEDECRRKLDKVGE